MKNIFKFFAIIIVFGVFSCQDENGEISKISKFAPFTFDNIPDEITLAEDSGVHTFKITFNDNQIYDFNVELSLGNGGTATEGKDFDILTHGNSVATLDRKTSFDIEIYEDVFLEGDEFFYLNFTSDSHFEYPSPKTVKVIIKNVGGCPDYVHSQYSGEYTVESDEWQDWTVGDVLMVEDAGSNKLSFKYNCGGDALPIVLTIHPDDFSISGEKQEYCSYSLPPLTKFYAEVQQADSQINTCDKVLNVAIKHTDANNANYGVYSISLKKK
ncbi:MAG: hypothetical protein H6567_06775 [Lewinellaceae bacterium]|nr:hypothetical protein [Lewinellaceae bacterium]